MFFLWLVVLSRTCPNCLEVETVRSGLEKAWVGKQISKVILRRENLRYPFPKDLISRLEGSTIVAVRRRAKYLLIDTDSQEVLLFAPWDVWKKYTLFDSQKVANFDLGDSIKQSVLVKKPDLMVSMTTWKSGLQMVQYQFTPTLDGLV